MEPELYVGDRKISGKGCKKWLGEKASGNAIHEWLKRVIGKPDHCDMCGRTEQPELTMKRGTPRKRNYFEWSNRTGVYSRNLHNWWQLCAACHRAYDGYTFQDENRFRP